MLDRRLDRGLIEQLIDGLVRLELNLSILLLCRLDQAVYRLKLDSCEIGIIKIYFLHLTYL